MLATGLAAIAFMLITIWEGKFEHFLIPGDESNCDRAGLMHESLAEMAKPDAPALKFTCVGMEFSG